MVASSGRARRLIAATALVLGIAVIAGCGTATSGGSNGDGPDTNNGAGNVTTFGLGHRNQVGNVTGTTLQGAPLSLANYRGKVVVVDFWSSDCGPCHGEEQSFEALSKEYADKGVQFVGVDERDNKDAALSFERQYHVTYPSLFDSSDSYLLDFPGSEPSSTPTTIVIDATGHIAAHVNGVIDYTHLRSLINSVRNESA